ncbi:MAG: hypothetical protein WEC83_00785, partial [Patescibacteria group bacterium]
ITPPKDLEIDSALAQEDFAGELEKVRSLLGAADQWITEVEPWSWGKDEPVSKDQINNLIEQSNLFEIAARLEPFMPKTAVAIRNQLKNLEAEPLFPRLEEKK